VGAEAALINERKDVPRRLGRLVSATEDGGDAASLVAKTRELESRQPGRLTFAPRADGTWSDFGGQTVSTRGSSIRKNGC
jgi:hypothetical protein